jgi:hypothetical protein
MKRSQSPLHGRAAAVLVISLLLAVLGFGAAQSLAATHAGHRVLIKGTAYSFDTQMPIAGATVEARGAPGAVTTSDSRGHYRLDVPAGRKVTPFIQAEGYHGIFLQTLSTHRRTLRKVNFQVPTERTYFALAALLHVKLDPNGDLSFLDFVAYGAHGVPGATAATSPGLGDPIYFNDNVIPDPSLTETSTDGGVIWAEVPSGTYRVRAQHPSKRFSSFVATCRKGRVVNANPPWGLHQLSGG